MKYPAQIKFLFAILDALGTLRSGIGEGIFTSRGEVLMHAQIRWLFAFSIVCLGIFSCPQTACANVGPPRLISLNDFYYTSAISADGTGVVGETSGGVSLWTQQGGVESFPLPAGVSLRAVNNLSGDGTTIVGGVRIGSGINQRLETFRWTRESGYQFLGRFSTDRFDSTYAHDVSHDGSVVVGTNDTPEGRRAFYWTESTGQINLGTLGSMNSIYDPFSEANAVSADGGTVVGYVTTAQDPYYKAFRWSLDAGFDVIGIPPVTVGIPAGGAGQVSGDGSVIVGISQATGNVATWTWTEQNGFLSLPSGPSGSHANVSGISFDGSTLVGNQVLPSQSNPSETITYAAIWRNTLTGYQFYYVEDLLRVAGVDITGWHLSGVTDVSYDGRVLIGSGIDPSGIRRSWYAILPVPEPSSLIALMLALGMSLNFRQHPS